MKIFYKKHLLKYRLAKEYDVATGIKVPSLIRTDYLLLQPTGRMVIMKGYSWDGPSGPTIDTKSFMRGALVHDAFYQLMRLGVVGQSRREEIDQLLRQMCWEDGMSWFRAWYVYHSVRKFAGKYAVPGSAKLTPTFSAP